MRNAFDDEATDLREEACNGLGGLTDPALRVIARLSEVPYEQLRGLRDGRGAELRYLPLVCNYLRELGDGRNN